MNDYITIIKDRVPLTKHVFVGLLVLLLLGV